jgi:hypothetical protein
MVSWQLKGLLLLATALVATALVATTSGAAPKPTADAVTSWPHCTAAALTREVTVATTVPGLSPCRYDR